MSRTGPPRGQGPWPQRMDNPIHHYDWGSQTALAWMQGRPPSGRPEAELWMGAHPSAPSAVIAPDGRHTPLDALVREQAADVLGADVQQRFGRLPFLLKVLAFDQPLSVQVHPDAEYARQAWQEQEAGAEPPPEVDAEPTPEAAAEPTPEPEPGTGADGEQPGSPEAAAPAAGHRYLDPYAKPELLYALQPVDAMCGFRTARQARLLLDLMGCTRLAELGAVLEDPGGDADEHVRLHRAFVTLLHWPEEDRAELAAEVGARARALLAGAGPLRPGGLGPAARRTVTWCSRLSRLYPKDPLVAAPLLLDLIRLEPGETLYVPAGAPHAYLYGLGVEIMASSDNVLRAGLTHKPIAIEELLRVVDGATRPARDVPEVPLGPFEVAWRVPAEEFQLTRLRLPDQAPTAVYPFLPGPQVLLCTAGAVEVEANGISVALRPGESAFLGAGGGPLTLAGPGEVFRATAGQPARTRPA